MLTRPPRNRFSVSIVLGGALLLFIVASIAESLARPGRRCENCGGRLIITKDVNDEWINATFYRCEQCGADSYEHCWKFEEDCDDCDDPS